MRVPGDDNEADVERHVRRLRALRRAGVVKRIDADHWRMPVNFETHGAEIDANRRGRVTLRVLSRLDLDSRIDANDAPWRDPELNQRRAALVDQSHAWRTPDNVICTTGNSWRRTNTRLSI